MRICLLGATGSIGSAVLRTLIARGHEIVALARSYASATILKQAGATPIRGDLARPEHWMARLQQLDAVIHMACDFDGPMADVDQRLVDALLTTFGATQNKPRFVYTGGCWLFGATGDALATEDSPFAPLPAFAWMVPHLQRVLASDAVHGFVVHPAMVHGGPGSGSGGVFRRFAEDAVERRAVRVVGGEAVRWPLVHCDDLAELYALVLERAAPGSSWLGAAVEGFPVGRIARTIARNFGATDVAPEIVSADAIAAELGDWARGYACDQRLSGAKARRELGWTPTHTDPEADVLAFRP